ncbi:MAG: LysM peptidoglycan-binding domain-containing protein [Oligoflexales bacterium]|nr:LysM peptidoglycan-binding domain-containing protein [Oligoflexales bacterium]
MKIRVIPTLGSLLFSLSGFLFLSCTSTEEEGSGDQLETSSTEDSAEFDSENSSVPSEDGEDGITDFDDSMPEDSPDTSYVQPEMPTTVAENSPEQNQDYASTIEGMTKVDDSQAEETSSPSNDTSISMPAAQDSATESTTIAMPSSETPTSESVTKTGTSGDEYVVKAGDSLSKIAKNLYGNMNRWHDIYEMNRDSIKDPDLIYIDQVIKIPTQGLAAH